MKIFDTHTHAFPDAIAKRSVEHLSDVSDGLFYYYQGDLGGLINYEKSGGASGFLILPIATNPHQTTKVNAWAAAAQKSNDMCFACGSLHPENENISDILDNIVSLGLRGIKLNPEYQDFFVDDEKMFPIYKEIFDRDLPVYFHAGVDLAYGPPIKGSPERIARVADKFPQGRIIAAHMGGYKCYSEVKKHLLGRRKVWFDTSFAAHEMPPKEVFAMITAHGSDRVMFGTDAPWAGFERSLKAVTDCGLSEKEQENVLWNTAEKLFKLT